MTTEQIETLVADAACINSCIPPGFQLAVLIYLADQIAAGGGTSGGAPDSIDYAGPPVVNPPALQNIVVDSAGQQFQFYAGAWH